MKEQHIALGQLERHLWEAANILRGPVDAADFKTYIFLLLFFKSISDVWDEEYQAVLADANGDLSMPSSPRTTASRFPRAPTGTTCARCRRMSAWPSSLGSGNWNLPTPICWRASLAMPPGPTASVCLTKRSRPDRALLDPDALGRQRARGRTRQCLGWQATMAGERLVKQALRKSLFKYKLHADEELFDQAYNYIRQYY